MDSLVVDGVCTRCGCEICPLTGDCGEPCMSELRKRIKQDLASGKTRLITADEYNWLHKGNRDGD